MRPLLRQGRDEEQRVSYLELFLDLVFVFAVTQVSHVLLEEMTWAGAAKAGFLLLTVWWGWIYTTWMTNWFDPVAVPVRLVLLLGMMASSVMAIAIPDAFGARAIPFAVGYVVLQFARNTFIVAATSRDEPLHGAFVRIWAWNTWVGAIWLAGAFVDDRYRAAVWLVALICDYAGPFARYWTPGIGRSETTDWDVEHTHFAERFASFVIIALGESVVLTASTASGLELTGTRIVTMFVSLLITATLWWLYFDEVAEGSLQDLEAAKDQGERERLARDAFTYLHIPMVAGIITTAVGAELVIAHPSEPLPAAELMVVIAGPLLYLAGHLGFRARMIGSLSPQRTGAAALLLVVGVVGTFAAATTTWALVFVALLAVVVVETAARLRPDPTPDGLSDT